ncbi:MAG: FAD-dependent oxidoreductase, partial [Solirubrobacterales bacterium]|nr:FAD-dependent oxidoreductase [Solirubrobacterales bacterium]
MTRRDLRVVVAGGGVAGLEALLALRSFAGHSVELILVTPDDDFVYRPLEVVEPFDSRAMVRVPWQRIAADLAVGHRRAGAQEVDLDGNRLRTTTAGELSFDVLIVATGATPRPAIPGGITLDAPGATERLRHLLGTLRA